MMTDKLVAHRVVICIAVLSVATATPVLVRADDLDAGTEATVDEVVEKAAEKAAVKAVEQVVGQAAEEAAAKAEMKARRPDEWRGPTTVNFLIFVLDVDQIDDATQDFTTNIYLRLRWQDPRLAIPDARERQIPMEEIWNPRILIANSQGIVSRALPEIAQVLPDGTVIYHQRYTGKLSQALKLNQFPMDQHVFTAQFVAAGYTADELTFLPDTSRGIVGGSMADELSLPDWKILGHEAAAAPYSPVEELNTAGFAFRFEAERYVAYYLWQVVLPLTVVVFMSCAAFWVERHDVAVRIGVATSSILTLIAHRFVVAALLPRLPYMTRMDYFTVGSTLLVFLSLLVVVLTSRPKHELNEVVAHRIDVGARIAFPLVFLLLLGWFLSG